jgi:translation initiation factor 2 alpha subunit (eIF-2alpha)
MNFIKDDKVMMFKILNVGEHSYQCKLIENWGLDIDGELLFTELTRKKSRIKPNKMLKIGSMHPLRIIDEESELLSLTKVQIEIDEIKECQNRYNKYRILDSILRGISCKFDEDMQSLYQHIILPILDIDTTPLDILIESNFTNLDVSDEIKDKLEYDVADRVLKKDVKINCQLKIKCYHENGINLIIEALKDGHKKGMKIYIETAPIYILSYQTRDEDMGKQLIEDSIQKIKAKIEAFNGQINVGTINVQSV